MTSLPSMVRVTIFFSGAGVASIALEEVAKLLDATRGPAATDLAAPADERRVRESMAGGVGWKTMASWGKRRRDAMWLMRCLLRLLAASRRACL